MKIWYILGILLASAILSSAQENNAGKVVYEQVVKLEIKLEGDAAQFADMLPKERKTNKVLYFNPEESLYQNGKSDAPDPMQMQHGSSNVMIRMEEPDNKVYTALSGAKQIEQREFMSRVFLIERKTENQWKLTGKQKMILDYPCQEAVMGKDSSRIVAWFTPVIQSQAGPGSYNGLPGLILAIDTDNGKNTITAQSVDFSELPKDALQKPDKGKKVTQEEFDAIVAEKMKEMGVENGGKTGGAHMMIQIKR